MCVILVSRNLGGANLKELNGGYTEFNPVPSDEQNEIPFENFNSANETNIIRTDSVKDKSRKKTQIRLLSSFIFLCAAVVILQVGIYIPIFSEIFSPPSQSSPEKVVSKEYITNVVIKPPFDDYDSHYDKWYKILDIDFDVDSTFDNYKMLVFELSFVESGKESLYSKLSKDIVNTKAGFPRYIIEKDGKTYKCNLKVYCTTDNPEEIEFEEKKSIPGEEDMCYLIYKYEGIIDF